MKRKTKSRIAFGVSGALLLIAAALVGAYLWMSSKAEAPSPSPSADEVEYVEEQGGLFPVIDWDYWKSVNPDVIGWVTVPGTAIDYPVVQARESDPTYYLNHDVYGSWNIYGCPYLDSECADDGFMSPNAVVFAHHMNNGSMFSDFAKYNSWDYALEHSQILLQTPDEKRVLETRFVDIISAWSTLKRTEFLNETDYRAWYLEMSDEADVVLDGESRPSHVLTFVTCSYNYWSNERTLVVASPEVDEDIWEDADDDGEEPGADGSSAASPDEPSMMYDRWQIRN